MTEPSGEALEAARKIAGEFMYGTRHHLDEQDCEGCRQAVANAAELIDSITQVGRLKLENEELRAAARDLLEWVPVCSVGSSRYIRTENLRAALSKGGQ